MDKGVHAFKISAEVGKVIRAVPTRKQWSETELPVSRRIIPWSLDRSC